MDDLVFDPAGMTHTRDDDALDVIPERARGYTKTRDGEVRRSRFRDVSENLPAGGHVSTAADLVRFALAFHNDALVSAESRARMTAPPPGSEQAESYYGFGIGVSAVEQLEGATMLAHSGGQDETRTFLALLPSAGLAVALMSNDESFSGDAHSAIIKTIFEIVLSP